MTKANVKVIKRSERAAQESQETAAEQTAKKSAPEAARDMVATVTGWVAEFKEQRKAETRQALKTLFRDPTAQPGKA